MPQCKSATWVSAFIVFKAETRLLKELDDKKPNKNNSKNPKTIVLLIHEEIFLYLYNSI